MGCILDHSGYMESMALNASDGLNTFLAANPLDRDCITTTALAAVLTAKDFHNMCASATPKAAATQKQRTTRF